MQVIMIVYNLMKLYVLMIIKIVVYNMNLP